MKKAYVLISLLIVGMSLVANCFAQSFDFAQLPSLQQTAVCETLFSNKLSTELVKLIKSNDESNMSARILPLKLYSLFEWTQRIQLKEISPSDMAAVAKLADSIDTASKLKVLKECKLRADSYLKKLTPEQTIKAKESADTALTHWLDEVAADYEKHLNDQPGEEFEPKLNFSL